MSNKKTVYQASDARKNFYSLLKDASLGISTYEVSNKHGDSVVMMSKNEYDGWRETLEIIDDPELMKSISKAKSQSELLSHSEMLKEIGLDE
jgi:prevent-host-death family protein